MPSTNTASVSAHPIASGDFLRSLEQILELPPDTLAGTDTLSGVGEWTSLAVLEFMALADERFGVTLGVDRITECATFNDLFALVAA